MNETFNFDIFCNSVHHSELNYFCGSINHAMHEFKIPLDELRSKYPLQNKIEFKYLAEQYKNITLSDIKKHSNKSNKWDAKHIASKLTGYGSPLSCQLCENLIFCKNCYWVQTTGNYCRDTAYYKDIEWATNPQELLSAFHKRSEVMLKLINRDVTNP